MNQEINKSRIKFLLLLGFSGFITAYCSLILGALVTGIDSVSFVSFALAQFLTNDLELGMQHVFVFLHLFERISQYMIFILFVLAIGAARGVKDKSALFVFFSVFVCEVLIVFCQSFNAPALDVLCRIFIEFFYISIPVLVILAGSSVFFYDFGMKFHDSFFSVLKVDSTFENKIILALNGILITITVLVMMAFFVYFQMSV